MLVGVFSRFCFFHYYFLNRRNNRRRPAPDNSSGVIRRFPFRSRSLVSVSESIIITLVDANKRVLSFLFLYYFFSSSFFLPSFPPGPSFVRLLLFFPKRIHRSPVSGTHARLHCFRPHTTPAPPPIIARGAQRRPAQQSDSAMTATPSAVRCCPSSSSSLWESKPCKQHNTIRGDTSGSGPK